MKFLQGLIAYGSLIVIVILMVAILFFLLAYTSALLFLTTLAVFTYVTIDMVTKLRGKS